jgi:hypothetical protein
VIAEIFPLALPLRARDGSVRAWTLVDVDVYDREKDNHWCWSKGYAVCQRDSRMIYLHRLVVGAGPGGLPVDHVNRNKMDNRRVNLRRVNKRQDCQNKPSLGGSSRHRGVNWDKTRRKWKAFAQLNGRYVHIGRFADEDTAAKAASNWRREHMPFSVES